MNNLNHKPASEQILDRDINEINRQMSSEVPPKKRKFKLFKSEAFSLGIMIIVGVTIGLTLSQFVFRPYRVVGESMSQTLHTGDRLIVNKLGKTWSNLFGNEYVPKRGEIVVFKNPMSLDLLVKRVIGLPGERVVVKDGAITVYNDSHPEGFNPDADTYYEHNLPEYTDGDIDIIVTEDSLFVSGDNRTPTGSSDSRSGLGLIPLENIIGDVVLRLLPLDQARFY